MNHRRLPGVAELLSQVIDVNVDHVRFGLGRSMPDRLGDLLSRDRASLVAHQVFQQSVLLLREVHGASAPFDLARNGIQNHVAYTQLRARRRHRCPPEKCLDASQQLRVLERFWQVIVGPGIESAYPVGYRRARGEHEHGCSESACAQGSREVHTVTTRKAHVENDEIRLRIERHRQAALAIRSREYPESRIDENSRKNRGEVLVIFDDEDGLAVASRVFGHAAICRCLNHVSTSSP